MEGALVPSSRGAVSGVPAGLSWIAFDLGSRRRTKGSSSLSSSLSSTRREGATWNEFPLPEEISWTTGDASHEGLEAPEGLRPPEPPSATASAALDSVASSSPSAGITCSAASESS